MTGELERYRKRKYLLYASAFCMDFALGIYLIIAPVGAAKLTDNNLILGSCGVIFLGSRVLLQLLFGKLSDWIGRKGLLMISLAVFAVSLIPLLAAKSISPLLVSFLFAGVGNAIFWPVLQAWIGDDVEGASLIRSLGLFNFAFSLGLAVGAIISGYLEMLSLGAAVALTLVFSFISFVLVLSRPSHSPKKLRELSAADNHGISQRSDSVYLPIARLANFASWAGVGVIRFLFVELTERYDISTGRFGAAVFCFYFGMSVFFLALRKFHFWQYRLAPILAAQAVGIFGFSLLGIFKSEFVFGAGLFLFGCTVATTYFSSLYYGLDGHIDKGMKSGLHETIMALGMIAAVIIGSVLAEKISMRAPYFFVALLVLASMIAELILHVRRRRPRLA